MSDLTQRERNDLVRGLLQELDLHGPGERSHAERVAVYSVATADALGIAGSELLEVRYAALLHDVGKVRVDARLLAKLGKLNDEEIAAMRQHAELGLEILERHQWLQPSLPSIIHHHERWDGNGYPTGLAKNLIPLGARVIAIAETFDVLAIGSPWAPRRNEAEARKEIEACSGSQFDPDAVQAFLGIQPLIQPVVV